MDLDNYSVLDFNPENQTIYYIEMDRLSSEDGSQFLRSYNFSTDTLMTIDKDFPYLATPWIGVGIDDEVYVLDNGRNPYRFDDNQRYIIEYRDDEKYATYELENIFEEDCEKYINSEYVNEYLGLVKTEENNIYPKFLVYNDGDSKRFYGVERCERVFSNDDLDIYINKNLQALNKETFFDTKENEDYLWVNSDNDFAYKEESSLFLMFGNSPCERVFDLVKFRGGNYRMGSCIFSIHDFPSSGNFFNEDGDLIYSAQRGIYLLK